MFSCDIFKIIIKCTLDFGQSLASADNVTVLPDLSSFNWKTIIKCTLDFGQFHTSATHQGFKRKAATGK